MHWIKAGAVGGFPHGPGHPAPAFGGPRPLRLRHRLGGHPVGRVRGTREPGSGYQRGHLPVAAADAGLRTGHRLGAFRLRRSPGAAPGCPATPGLTGEVHDHDAGSARHFRARSTAGSFRPGHGPGRGGRSTPEGATTPRPAPSGPRRGTTPGRLSEVAAESPGFRPAVRQNPLSRLLFSGRSHRRHPREGSS